MNLTQRTGFDLMNAVAISPNYSVDQMMFAGNTYDGIYRTTDGGQTWPNSNSGLTVPYIWSMALSPVYSSDKTIFAATEGGLWQTGDGGQNWSLRQLLPNTFGSRFTAVAASPNYSVDRTAFSGSEQTIYKSTDGGQTWNQVYGKGSYAIAISPNYASDHTVIVSPGISTDGGQTWTSLNDGLSSPWGELSSVDVFRAIAFSPSYMADRTVFAGVFWGGVSKSTDGGFTWAQSGLAGKSITSVAVSNNYVSDRTLFAGDWYGGIYKSIDGGQNWSQVRSTGRRIIMSPNYSLDQTLFVDGFSRSTDGGATWSQLTQDGLVNIESVYSLAVSPTFGQDHNIFAGFTRGGIFSYTFFPDTTSPTTTLNTSPVSSNGNNGWFKTTPSITLTRNEPGTTYYSWTSATGPWTTYSISFNASEGQNTLYYYSQDIAGNPETVKSQLFKVDIISPTAPVLSAVVESSTSIRLEWTGASDVGSGLGAYEVYDGENRISGSSESPHTLSGLSPGTTYNLTVRATDMAGNLSSPSNTVSATTLSATDTTPPSTPANLSAVPISSSQINLSWNASTDNVGVTGYKIYDADTNAEIATTASTSYSHTGLSSGTTHNYYIKAFDAVGNISSSSNIALATTFTGGTNNTQTGANTEVNLGNGVSLTFDNITTAGTTSVTTSTTPLGGPPSGFRFRGYYYDVTTTATFSGFIAVQLPYNEADISGNEANLKLFHWNGSNWEDVTVSVDTVNNIITGKVTSLSPFGVGESAIPSTGYNTYWLLIVGISLMVSGGCLLLRGKKRLV
jgi:LPXTG-motif cell wall-anchored protein